MCCLSITPTWTADDSVKFDLFSNVVSRCTVCITVRSWAFIPILLHCTEPINMASWCQDLSEIKCLLFGRTDPLNFFVPQTLMTIGQIPTFERGASVEVPLTCFLLNVYQNDSNVLMSKKWNIWSNLAKKMSLSYSKCQTWSLKTVFFYVEKWSHGARSGQTALCRCLMSTKWKPERPWGGPFRWWTVLRFHQPWLKLIKPWIRVEPEVLSFKLGPCYKYYFFHRGLLFHTLFTDQDWAFRCVWSNLFK